jgi:hypothetical protein
VAACLCATLAHASPPRGRRVHRVLPEAVIRAHLRKGRDDVHTCVALVSRRGDPVPPRIDVELVIAPAGRVERARVTSPHGSSSSLARCVAARARTWSFPRARDRSHARAPFVLQ